MGADPRNCGRISLVLLVYVVQEAATTAYVTLDNSDALYSFLIFIYNLADSLFLGVLLVISCGWQITRDSFKDRRFIFWFPPIHFACSATVDYILDRHIGHRDSKDEVAYIPDPTERTILIFAYFGSIITLFYGWWWIFTCLAIERAELHKKIDNHGADSESDIYDDDDDDSDRSDYEDRTAAGANADLPDADPDADRPRLTSVDLGGDVNGDEDEVVFEAAAGEGEGGAAERRRRRTRAQRRAARARANAGQLGETLIDGDGDRDTGSPPWSPSVDHSAMPDRAKLRMLTQYGVMVQCYLFIVLVVLLVNAWRQDRTVASIVLLELLNLSFLAGLLYTFRLRATNPYYMLDEHDYHDDTYGAPVDSLPITVLSNTFEIGGNDDDDDEVV